ncbi:MAG: putative PurR-regulated permease PerM [Candidatus Promineifilaceae bacterium]|jgi:predicted PurR-regulated permease PerM
MAEHGKLTKVMFTEKQRRTIAAGVTIVCAVIIVAFLALVFKAVVGFCSTFSGVFMPLAVGALLAVLLRPYYDFLQRRLKMNAIVAVVIVFLSFLIPLAAFVAGFGMLLVDQMAGLSAKLPEWYAAAYAWVEFRLIEQSGTAVDAETNAKVSELIQANWERIAATAHQVVSETIRAGIGLFGWVIGLLGWFIVPVYLAFFLITPSFDVGRLEGLLPFLKPSTRKDAVYLCREFIDILVAFFRGQIVVAIAQGLLFAIGFSIVGLDYGFVIGLMLGVLNVVPYLGNVIGLAIALPISYVQEGGGLVMLGLVLLIFVVVQVIEGAFLTPRIMGKRTGLHPIVIIIAMFFWGTALDGIAGMILAVPLTAFIVVFWRLAKTKYIKEIV